MTPDAHKAELDRLGRTNVMDLLKEPTIREGRRQAIYRWLSDDDRNNAQIISEQRRDARRAMYAAWVAAIAAMIAAVAAIVK